MSFKIEKVLEEHVMKTLIAECLRDHDFWKKSLRNCHVVGLTSIILCWNDRLRWRMFIAEENHELWKNKNPFSEELAIACHPHHCDLILECWSGYMVNSIVDVHSGFGDPISKWSFDSKINGGTGGFVFSGQRVFMQPKKWHRMRKGDESRMDATTVHTVYVPKGETASWFIYEGAENPEHYGACYSNRDLSKHTTEGLYIPMTHQEVCFALHSVGLFDEYDERDYNPPMMSYDKPAEF